MNNTKIQWAEKVWNPVTGCTKVTAGCKNCYAENIAKRFWKDRKFSDVQCHDKKLNDPTKIKNPSTIFVTSMGDLFHKDIQGEFILKVFVKMFDNFRHKFIILTKRPERMSEFIDELLEQMWEIGVDNVDKSIPFNELTQSKALALEIIKEQFLKHIYLGVSISEQKDLWMLDILKQIPVKNKIISFEPLLENIECDLTGISWVIIGAESGMQRRFCDNHWVDLIQISCKMQNVPIFIKQLHNQKTSKKLIKDINEFPEHLQIQQYPF